MSSGDLSPHIDDRVRDRDEESMDWELFTPDVIAERAGRAGFREIERCEWWDEARDPSSEEQRFQIVLERI